MKFLDRLHLENKVLKRKKLEILQVNLGKLCNLTCSHCHVEAGPTKKIENMSEETVLEVVAAMDRLRPKTLDLTGGAPEMNPHFKTLVKEAKKRNIEIIDRCNLSILLEPGFEDLPGFLSAHQVIIIASLPCYEKDNVDKQRGQGVFDDSIKALLLLNQLGYGKANTELILNLVYNPVGEHLPGLQSELEKDYKRELYDLFKIEFNRLFTITNMPITRYEKYLKAIGAYENYLHLLRENFNSENVEHLMCRNTLSVSWDGRLFDCDFNQAINLEIEKSQATGIKNVYLSDLENSNIRVGEHCYGCAAGSGSSCQGSF